MRFHSDLPAGRGPARGDLAAAAESDPPDSRPGSAPGISFSLLDVLQRRFGFAAALAASAEVQHHDSGAAARALQAAQDVRTALDGVDYLTRMQMSALLSGHGFLACCREGGVEPGSLTLQRRRALDEQMASHFQRAVDAGGSLAAEQAAVVLRGLLRRLRAD